MYESYFDKPIRFISSSSSSLNCHYIRTSKAAQNMRSIHHWKSLSEHLVLDSALCVGLCYQKELRVVLICPSHKAECEAVEELDKLPHRIPEATESPSSAEWTSHNRCNGVQPPKIHLHVRTDQQRRRDGHSFHAFTTNLRHATFTPNSTVLFDPSSFCHRKPA